MKSNENLLKNAYSNLLSGDTIKALKYYIKFENKYESLKKYISANKKISINRIKRASYSKDDYKIVVGDDNIKNPLISVIVPVFNSAKYLQQCIKSILEQSLLDIEIICIDDGSSDDSLDILITLACVDNRIKVVSQKNKYAGAARNLGIELSQGKYLIFLDSDDFFDEKLCEKLFDAAESSGSEIAVCDMRLWDEKTGKISNPNWSLKTSMLPNENFFFPIEAKDVIFNFTNNWVWNKIFRSDFIKNNKIKFQNIRHTNDLYFMCVALIKSKSISVIKDRLITYRTNVEKSLTSLNTRNESYRDVIECFSELRSSLKKANLFDEYSRSFINLCISQVYWNFKQINLDDVKKKFISSLFEEDFFGLHINYGKDLFFDESTYSRYKEIISFFNNEQLICLHTINNIDNFKIISFDIFDTLVLRPFLKPSDLFKQIELLNNNPGFYESRINAEKKARRNIGLQEIDIDDIYDLIPPEFSALKEIEIEKEVETTFGNKLLINLFNKLISKGKIVVLTSDMYLKEVDIRRILEKCGVRNDAKLFLSSSFRKTKREGDLFYELMKEYKVLPNEIFHIGDNFNSDYDVPRKLGINAYHYIQSDVRKYSGYFEAISSVKRGVKNNLVVDTLHRLNETSQINFQEDFWFRFGYNYAGPLAVSFASEIKKKTDLLNPDVIFFIARDGYLINKVYDLISGRKIPSYYIYASRGLIRNIDKGVVDVEDYKEYIKSEVPDILEGKKILVVDTTTINLTAQKFISNIFGKSQVVGFYWLANSNISGMDYSCIFSRPHEVESINFLVETLLSAPTPPVNSIANSMPMYEEITEYESKRCGFYSLIADGALYFANQIFNDKNYKNLELSINPEVVFEIIHKFLKRITVEEYLNLSQLSHTGDLFNKDSRSIGFYLNKFRKPIVSIIVCVYNGEEFLEECLLSVKNQTLMDLELICIDDCSTDASYEIIKKICSNDSRFKYFKNDKNIGLASSRNKAISIASGDYIQFLDADDYIIKNTCEELIQRCHKLDLDMLSFSGFNFDMNGVIMPNKYWSFNYLPNDWNKTWFTFKDCLDFSHKMAVSSCLTIYKKSFINKWGISFPDGVFYEDNLFFCKSIVKANRISIHKGQFYARRIHSESITQNWNKHFSDYIKVASLVLRFLNDEKIKERTLEQYKNNFSNVIDYYYCRFDDFYKEKYKIEIKKFSKEFNVKINSI